MKSTYCSVAPKIEGYILFGLPVPFHVPWLSPDVRLAPAITALVQVGFRCP